MADIKTFFFILSLHFDSDNHVKFYMNIDYKHSYRLYMKYGWKSTFINIATVRKFEVISNKFNADVISCWKNTTIKLNSLLLECYINSQMTSNNNNNNNNITNKSLKIIFYKQ
jgi:hypothetical protein